MSSSAMLPKKRARKCSDDDHDEHRLDSSTLFHVLVVHMRYVWGLSSDQAVRSANTLFLDVAKELRKQGKGHDESSMISCQQLGV